ncbi:MAG: DUF2141 domain-containing protein [Candidatus Kapaibacterium sp.]
MIKIIVMTLLLLTTASSQYQLTVEVENVNPGKGTLYLAFYDNKSDFLDHDKTTFFKAVKSDSKTVSVTIPKVKKGWWAMAVLQDENGNKKMDYNFIGAPKESYGFSNNPRIFMAEPTDDDCKFYILSVTSIRVDIK